MRFRIIMVLVLAMLTYNVWAAPTMTAQQAKHIISTYAGCDVNELIPVGSKDGYRQPKGNISGGLRNDGVYAFSHIDRQYRISDNARPVLVVSAIPNANGIIKGFNEDDIWASIPGIQKADMAKVLDHATVTVYHRKFVDGSYDDNVRCTMFRNVDGEITSYGFQNSPFPIKPMHATVTRDEAIQIATVYANNYQFRRNDTVSIFGYSVCQDVTGPYQMIDDYGICAPIYKVRIDITDNDSVYTNLRNGSKKENTPYLNIWIDAGNGQIVWDDFQAYVNDTNTKTTDVSNYKPNRLSVIQNLSSVLLFTVPVKQGDTCLLPLTTIQALAKGHTVTAKADAKAFKLDGKELALPAKVLSRKGVLYLPWQSLNSLPGVKAQYDAKLAKLDITTASVTAAK